MYVLNRSIVVFFLSLITIATCNSCAALLQEGSSQSAAYTPDSESRTLLSHLPNSFSVGPQTTPPQDIRSIQLYRDAVGNAPIIRLGSSERLTLKFDEISSSANSFTVRVRHFNSDWSESLLLPNFIARGFGDDTFSGGVPGVGQNPSFFSYTYSFPNRNLQFLVSGNFMLDIYEYHTNELLFSLPFFVSEDRGRIDASISEFFSNSRFPYHQVFTEFFYPSFVSIPLTEIEIYVAQNQFWGRAIRSSQRDVSSPGSIRMHQTREEGFRGRFEFRPLRIDDIFSISRDVLEVRPDRNPPLIRLNYDTVDLDINPRPSRSYAFGAPLSNRNARYTEVEFNLDRPDFIEPDSEIYVTGSFMNWALSEDQLMQFNKTDNAFSTRVMIKEGRYDYIYVMINPETQEIDDLSLSAFFASSSQDYQVFVYFKDQQNQYDRLLQFGTIRSR
ncbi:MAG: DUF5103 domain-containing protein [Balneolales bacterium]|nr:DUF5103 domain-containing protein [Balneolales bacterium]